MSILTSSIIIDTYRVLEKCKDNSENSEFHLPRKNQLIPAKSKKKKRKSQCLIDVSLDPMVLSHSIVPLVQR